jgi:hypothetical protein
MSLRVLFKIDAIEKHERHTGYERKEDGSLDRSKPTVAKYATVRLSAVVPDVDAKGAHLAHPNYQVWRSGIAGTLILNNVDESIAAALKNGAEYAIDLSPAQ